MGELARGTGQPTSPEDAAIDVLDALKRVPLFRQFKGPHLSALAVMGTRRQLPMGSLIARAGDPYTGLFVVLNGQLVQTDAAQTITLDPGDYVGEIAAVETEVAPGDVRTTCPTDVLMIRSQHLHSIMRSDPEVGILIARTLGRRVREATPLPEDINAAETARVRQQML